MMESSQLLLVQTTCADAETAEQMARGLVAAHVAACVSIGSSIRSVYPWHGRVEIENEVPLLIKTTAERLEALKRFILDHHDYEIPELLVTQVVDGHEAYLRWARDWVKHD